MFFPGFSVDTLITSSNVWQVIQLLLKVSSIFFSLNGYDPRSSDYIFQLRLDISPVFICELSFHLCFYLISSFLICVPQRYLLQSWKKKRWSIVLYCLFHLPVLIYFLLFVHTGTISINTCNIFWEANIYGFAQRAIMSVHNVPFFFSKVWFVFPVVQLSVKIWFFSPLLFNSFI